jgi:hypothetical protein
MNRIIRMRKYQLTDLALKRLSSAYIRAIRGKKER